MSLYTQIAIKDNYQLSKAAGLPYDLEKASLRKEYVKIDSVEIGPPPISPYKKDGKPYTQKYPRILHGIL